MNNEQNRILKMDLTEWSICGSFIGMTIKKNLGYIGWTLSKLVINIKHSIR